MDDAVRPVRDGATELRARWIVAFDGTDHRILENGVVVYAGDRILHVGPSWGGRPSRVVEAGRALVIPGLISTHAHVGAGYGDRLIVDGGRRDLQRSGFLNHEPRRAGGGPGFTDPADPDASIRFGFASLLRHGVTTVVEMGGGLFDGGVTMLRRAGECGIRLYYGPGYNPGTYSYGEDGILRCRIDEDEALRGLDRAGEFIARHSGANGARYQGLLIPDEAFTSTPLVLSRTRAAADALGVGVTIHVAEQLYEFHDALRRTGRTPVGLLADAGFLGPDAILGHCRFVSGNSQVAYPHDEDLDVLALSGATVAHAPLAGARRGGVLESFQRFLDRGVRLSIGTDTYPLDIVAEMHAAAVLGKVVDANHEAARSADVFRAATLGGADALGRPDLGRLAPGAKADLVVVDMDTLRVGPVRDPVRSLLHAATGEHVRTVVVDGATVMEEGRPLAWDVPGLAARIRAAVAPMREGFPAFHWSGQDMEEVFPPSYPRWRERADTGARGEAAAWQTA